MRRHNHGVFSLPRRHKRLVCSVDFSRRVTSFAKYFGKFAAALFREPAPPWVSSPSALAVMGARIPWTGQIQLVPSSEFLTLSTSYFSHGPPTLFHAGGTPGVSLGPMRSTWRLSLADLICPNFPLQGSLPWTMEFYDEPLLLQDSSQRQTAAPAPASPHGVFIIPLGGI